ncbi:MAG: hypothetical protein HS129_15075 [Leptospiraceae bacterium]|nr:hypothetical protein [Leptospiraceae bacterium]
MSASSQIKSGFEKYLNSDITFLKPDSLSGNLNALKKKNFTPLKSVRAYWINEESSEKRDSGESQGYSAIILLQFDGLEDHETEINQECRIIKREILEDEPWNSDEEWLIKRIQPVDRIDGYWIIEFEVYQPAKGNRVHLR